MGRSRNSNNTSNKHGYKDGSFDMLNNHEEFPEAGWYLGTPKEIVKEKTYLKVSASITSLDHVHDYGVINGFLPVSYTDNDITADFMEAFDNPKKFSDVIGKEVKVYVDFFTNDEGTTYANIVGFEKE